ncbi:hypothetical protein F5Y19DRAFT_451756 [Xylariaceae sp. FL1651]|nr:hypothetical protein F5Y19DRAFT_451756 [Xylariaceae sp. FL1651]
MRSILAPVMAFMVATVVGQNQTGPYAIHIKGKTDSSIDGYASACHAGAAIEGLCYEAGPAVAGAYEFYYNYSAYSPDTGEVFQPGWIVWNLPYNGNLTESETMLLQPNPGSNVEVALFEPGYGTYVSFDESGRVYISGGYDDSHFNATPPVSPPSLGNLTNFHLCYQYTGTGYYYHSISWVTTPPARNPSCQPVDLILESAKAV